MKLSKSDVYLVAGIGLIVGAFFAAAKAVGGVLALAYFLSTTDYAVEASEMIINIANSMRASQISESLQAIGSFLILFFGGRWMLRGPALLDRWIDSLSQGGTEGDSASGENG